MLKSKTADNIVSGKKMLRAKKRLMKAENLFQLARNAFTLKIPFTRLPADDVVKLRVLQ